MLTEPAFPLPSTVLAPFPPPPDPPGPTPGALLVLVLHPPPPPPAYVTDEPEIEFKIKDPGFVVREDFLFESGSLFVNNGDILPSTDKGSNLGSEERRFANIYAGDLELSNEDHPKGGNEIDGTKGKWTIQEGEDDLFLINRKSGKRYKFLLQNIDD